MAISAALKNAIIDAAFSIHRQNMFLGVKFRAERQVPRHNVGIDVPDRPNANEGRRSQVYILIHASLDHPFCEELKEYCDMLDERPKAEISSSAGNTLIEIIPNMKREYFTKHSG